MPMLFSAHLPLALTVFSVVILGIVALDLGLFYRTPREIKVREALWTTAAYIFLALCFNAWIYWHSGHARAVEFLTSYFIEYALSMDNILVFVVILSYFQVPPQFQMRVLLWGIVGALILRGVFILAGLTLIETFDWTVIVLGAFPHLYRHQSDEVWRRASRTQEKPRSCAWCAGSCRSRPAITARNFLPKAAQARHSRRRFCLSS